MVANTTLLVRTGIVCYIAQRSRSTVMLILKLV